jgi:hypothetical protein
MIQTLDLRQRVKFIKILEQVMKRIFLKILRLKIMEQIWVIFLHFGWHPLKLLPMFLALKYLCPFETRFKGYHILKPRKERDNRGGS